MMKKVIFLLICLVMSANVNGQTSFKSIKATIETFFEGFHNQDSVLMKSVLADNVLLQTTGRDSAGKTTFSSMPIQRLMVSITGIPDSVQFQEKLTSWSIQQDRTMANAWVGYEFWYNNVLSHCGINSFQLVNFNGDWKIVYLIDTRGREGCNGIEE
ncbi:nuclear transport factor 2 family protein [Croceitalea dokdonensis]|nr:nuclear transport factor 2 family protein [Croceitalea dokdonensis]